MGKPFHTHKVTINDRRRDNKKKSDVLNKGASPEDVQQVFNTCYKDQVRALYRAVLRGR